MEKFEKAYGYESRTLPADLERQTKTFENKCYRKMLGVIIPRTQNKRLNMAIGQPPCQTSGVSSYWQLLGDVANYNGSAMSASMIGCRKSCYREQ